jgi:predicted deacylase
VEIEGGTGGDMARNEIETMHAGLLRGLRNYGVLAGGKDGGGSDVIRVDVGPGNQYAAPADGLVEHRVGLGQEVAAGQVVALLHPVAGASARPTEILAPAPGYVLRQRAKAFVRKGELIGNTGTAR